MNFASGSTFTPISGRRARVRVFRRAAAQPVDLVIVRENTEGFYADRKMYQGSGEFMPTPDLALAVRKITRQGSTRIAETAFKLAMQRRKKVTAVHKANVLRVSDGLYLECVRAVAKNYPQVAYEERIIDAMAALLVRDASPFDVVVTTNMYGDILSDEASEIAGSLGLAASLNAGAEYAVAQAQHGSAPDIAGKNVANPSSLIGSAAMLLAWLGERRKDDKLVRAAAAIEAALDRVIADPKTRTPDMGGTLGTDAVRGEGRAGGSGEVVKLRRIAHQHARDQRVVLEPARQQVEQAARVDILERRFLVERLLDRVRWRVRPVGAPDDTIWVGLAERAGERIDARIVRIVADAVGAGNLHPGLTALQQALQRAQRAIRCARRDQPEMVDDAVDRQRPQHRRQRLDTSARRTSAHASRAARTASPPPSASP